MTDSTCTIWARQLVTGSAVAVNLAGQLGMKLGECLLGVAGNIFPRRTEALARLCLMVSDVQDTNAFL